MNKRITVTSALFLAGLLHLLGPPISHAQVKNTGYPERSLGQIAASSDLIITGRIVRVMSLERENKIKDRSFNRRSRYIVKLAWIEVDEVLKGNAQERDRVKLVYPAQARISGEPVYEDHQRGVWLLRHSERPGEFLADHPRRYQKLRKLDKIKAMVSSMGPAKDAKSAPKRKIR